jgi:hypothetical protein
VFFGCAHARFYLYPRRARTHNYGMLIGAIDRRRRPAGRILLAAALVAVTGLTARGTEPDLEAAKARFKPDSTPVRMEYDVAYRFLNIELSRLGKIVMLITTGTYQHRVTGQTMPAALVELRMDTPDSRDPARRNRVSMHDRIVAVVDMPGLNALVFGKDTDEYLNPLIGRKKVTRTVSCYDTQSGGLDYAQRDFLTGVVTTNVSNPQALLSLSRQIGPLAAFLIKSYRGQSTGPDDGKVCANADGEVVTLIMQTRQEGSPAFFQHQRLSSLHVETVPAKGTRVRVYDFEGWAVPFDELANRYGDEALRTEARTATVETVVPLVMQYALGLGSIRATLCDMGVGNAPGVPPETTPQQITRSDAPSPAAADDKSRL